MSITLAAPIAAFFTAIGSEAGKDAYVALKRWLRRVANADSRYVGGVIRIVDCDGTSLEVTPKRLSDEAIAGLLEVEWSNVSGHELVWSEERSEWMTSEEQLDRVTRPWLAERGRHYTDSEWDELKRRDSERRRRNR